MPDQPSFDWLGAVNRQAVEHQETPLAGTVYEPSQEVNKDVGTERIIDDFPAQPPVAFGTGNDRQAVTAVRQPYHRHLALRRAVVEKSRIAATNCFFDPM